MAAKFIWMVCLISMVMLRQTNSCRCKPECANRTYEPRDLRWRRLPHEPAQDLRYVSLVVTFLIANCLSAYQSPWRRRSRCRVSTLPPNSVRFTNSTCFTTQAHLRRGTSRSLPSYSPIDTCARRASNQCRFRSTVRKRFHQSHFLGVHQDAGRQWPG